MQITSEQLLSKHGCPCPYCLRLMNVHSEVLRPSRDHVRPRSRFEETRIFIVCQECNQIKSDRTLEEWIAFLSCKNLELERNLLLNNHRLKNLEYLLHMGLT